MFHIHFNLLKYEIFIILHNIWCLMTYVYNYIIQEVYTGDHTLMDYINIIIFKSF